ncbi:MAG: membrane dipeptidase [Chloroflexi bacterium]|nr:membrane dipeptidase [Chloroflexota bacterium]
MIIFDGHLDISFFAMEWGHEQTWSVSQLRQLQATRNLNMAPSGAGIRAGTSVVALPELRQARIATIMSPIYGRVAREGPGNLKGGWRTQQIAYARAQGFIAYHRVLEAQGHIRIIKDAATLDAHMAEWENGTTEKLPVGTIISMECADPIVYPDQVYQWWEDGLRVIGLTHFGINVYAHGTGVPGPLFPAARPLLKAMEEAGFILDTTHLAEEAFWQALEIFHGPVIASHNNCRAYMHIGRHITDDQVKALIERGAVIGAVLEAWQLYPNYEVFTTPNTVVSGEEMVRHIDRICQIAGNTRHVAIGTDLAGKEWTPHDFDSIADLPKVISMLQRRGYSPEDIGAILHGNWHRFYRETWNRHA